MSSEGTSLWESAVVQGPGRRLAAVEARRYRICPVGGVAWANLIGIVTMKVESCCLLKVECEFCH